MHCSATSQFPALGLQVFPDKKVSVGQLGAAPVQFSTTSQEPAEARHIVVFGDSVSPGQTAVVPVQFSAGSQKP